MWLIVVVKEMIKKIKKTQKELDKVKLRQQQCCSSLNWILQLSHWFEWKVTDSHQTESFQWYHFNDII